MNIKPLPKQAPQQTKLQCDQERVILVDEQDNIIGSEEKLFAHQQGLLHRAFSIFVYRKNGTTESDYEFLLQRRSLKKYHSAGLWSNSCCSHPRPKESILMAAERRLQEELSLQLPLLSAGSFQYRAVLDNGLIEHELDHVLLAEFPKGLKEDINVDLLYNPEEIQEIRWMSVDLLKKDLQQFSNRYTPWLKPALEIAWCKLCYIAS
jgi:isopentenyl-diphosphate delta-isomerase type 1